METKSDSTKDALVLEQERISKEAREKLEKGEAERKAEFEKRQKETDEANSKLIAESDAHLAKIEERKKADKGEAGEGHK
jgi:hypothetical protein